MKFDVAYPYGEQHTQFSKLAEVTRGMNNILVAEVAVKDYGDKENQDLADRFVL